MSDPYAVTAGAYDLFARGFRAGQLAAIEQLVPLLRPEAGPILDVGAGSAANAAEVLDRIPDARVLALEPSRSMRALALQRIAAHPEWSDRVTVRPEDFFSAPLPERIGGALLLGVLGHFDSVARAALLAELAERLPEGGAALVDLQDPDRPHRVEPTEFTAARIGALDYRGIMEGWPLDDERMRWRMTYLTVEDDCVILEEAAEHVFHHPGAERFAAECAANGLSAERIAGTTFWIIRH